MMNFFRKILPLATLTVILVSLAYLANAAAPGAKLSESQEPYAKGVNKHNLSSTNTRARYKAAEVVGDTRGQQICIFCHTPHNANVVGQAPLWNRKFSDETAFQRYSSGTLKIRGIPSAQYGDGAQPNGSSKLCLSCHDGISKLGKLYGNGLDTPEIQFAPFAGQLPVYTDPTVIQGLASFKPDTNKMKSGHHPVSFVYTGAIATAINDLKVGSTPMYTIPSITEVKLDKQSRMQCTTCHNAHQNMSNDTECYGGTCDTNITRKIAPFWVYGFNGVASTDQQDVCLTCHPMNGTAGFVYNPPWIP